VIQCICGLPGEGKTIYAVWLVEQLVRQGRRVVTNIELKTDHPAYDRVYSIGSDDYPVVSDKGCFFNHFPPGSVYVIDEADVYFDASDHGKTPQQVRLYFKQHRKRRDDVVLIVQYPANLYVRIRRLVNEWVWCYRDGAINGLPGVAGLLLKVLPKRFHRFNRNTYALESMQHNSLIRSGYITTKEASAMYDWYTTEQLIGDCSFQGVA
jgi:zonular occludens toxin Zot